MTVCVTSHPLSDQGEPNTEEPCHASAALDRNEVAPLPSTSNVAAPPEVAPLIPAIPTSLPLPHSSPPLATEHLAALAAFDASQSPAFPFPLLPWTPSLAGGITPSTVVYVPVNVASGIIPSAVGGSPWTLVLGPSGFQHMMPTSNGPPLVSSHACPQMDTEAPATQEAVNPRLSALFASQSRSNADSGVPAPRFASDLSSELYTQSAQYETPWSTTCLTADVLQQLATSGPSSAPSSGSVTPDLPRYRDRENSHVSSASSSTTVSQPATPGIPQKALSHRANSFDLTLCAEPQFSKSLDAFSVTHSPSLDPHITTESLDLDYFSLTDTRHAFDFTSQF